MKNDGNPSQTVSAVSFRKLADKLEEGDIPEDILSFDEKTPPSNFFKRILFRIYNWMRKRAGNNLTLVSFLFDLSVYLGIRIRVLMVLLGVTAEVLSSLTDRFKKKVIKNMFWGRGYLFKLSVQFVSVIVMVIITSSYVYRSPAVSAQFEAGQAPLTDIVAMRGSTVTQIPDDRLDEGSKIYVVKVGDTISRIANANGVTEDTILWANNLTENSVINPGEELKIPPGNGVLVKVKKRDTIESLAKKYNSNEQAILDGNIGAIFPPDFALEVGSEVFIPDGKPPEPPTPAAPIYSGVIASNPVASVAAPGAGRFLGWPVQGGAGSLIGYFTGPYLPQHTGVDIGSVSGFPNLVAAASGTVTFAGCHGYCPTQGLGKRGGYNLAWTVKINHGNGLETVYAHMDTIAVRSGQFVSAGQVLGRMGQTGTAYGVHVHFMVVKAGTWYAYNPLLYMR